MSMDVIDKSEIISQSQTYAVHKLGPVQPLIPMDHWRSHLICRVSGSKEYSDGNGSILLDTKTDKNKIKKDILMSWVGMDGDFERTISGYQDNDLTQWAAVAFSGIAVREVLDADITRVTHRGQGFDYWIGEESDLGLEVSGTTTGGLDNLRDNKADQLLGSPLGVDGYVSVTDFKNRNSYLWFYEATP